MGSLEKQLFLFSDNNDLESSGGARGGTRWTLDTQLGYLGSMGWAFPYNNGKVTFISITAASALKLEQIPRKQVT